MLTATEVVGVFWFIGTAIGVALWIKRHYKQTKGTFIVHWIGRSPPTTAFASVTVLPDGDDGAYFVALLLVGGISGGFLYHWWTKVRPTATT